MGKYKRNKSKKKSDRYKDFVSPATVRKYILDNKEFLENLPNDKFKITRREIEFGDRWYNEYGFEYQITFPDNTEYVIGHVYITEDSSDWAQAESHSSDIMRNLNGNKTTGFEILNKFKNIESLHREERLKKLL